MKAITILLCTFLLTISCQAQTLDSLMWQDNINNIENLDYANEVRVNAPQVHSDYQIQLLFCDRYYETCQNETLEWYFNQLSFIKKVFHVWVK